MKTKSLLLLTVLFTCGSILFTGCGKKKGCTDPYASNYNKDNEEDDGNCTYVAGTGGQATIVAFPQHHGKTIYNLWPFAGHPNGYLDTAYVKFNTTDFPGTNPSSYDMTFVGEAGEDHVHLEGLKRGQYYVYMAGFDTSGLASGTQIGRVTGGIPYNLTQSTGEVDVDIPVTE